MHIVVTMADIGAAIFAELDLERDLPVTGGAKSPDVLSHQPFGRRDRVVAAIERDAFFEVQVNGMVPASAAIDQSPLLYVSRSWDQESDAVGIEAVGLS